MASTRLYGPSAAQTSPATPPPLNTQATANQSPVLPAKQVIASSAEAIIQNPQTTSASAPTALLVQIPSGSPLEGKPFDLVFSGWITTTTSGSVTLKIYEGTSTTPGSNTSLGSSSTVTQNSASAPFIAKATLIFDSTSGKLQGSTTFLVNNSVVAVTAVSNVVTGLNNTNNPVASFALSITLSGGAGTIQVDEAAINF